VNFVLDWDEVIHDGGEVPAHVSDRDAGEDPVRQAGRCAELWRLARSGSVLIETSAAFCSARNFSRHLRFTYSLSAFSFPP
jgi:hypothetical protein